MNTIKVRDIEIGAGAPKIIVPIVGVTKEDILNEAKTFDSIPVDVVEWRVDWFEHVFEFDKVEDVLKELRTVLGNIPLLLTFRTKKEGGEKAIDTKDYKELNLRSMKLTAPGGILVSCSCSQFMTPELFLKMLKEAAMDCGRQVRLLETLIQSRDHPACLNAEQALYLKGYILQVL